MKYHFLLFLFLVHCSSTKAPSRPLAPHTCPLYKPVFCLDGATRVCDKDAYGCEICHCKVKNPPKPPLYPHEVNKK